ncbi:MAG UNVERIFIED_CONTAM: hypothetical protein LVQ98_08395 [Rickettsiaceae bacterium]|jgi:hypothetical protein
MSIRADLAIPVESVLLDRTLILQDIDEKFLRTASNIKIVALIGPGGDRENNYSKTICS